MKINCYFIFLISFFVCIGNGISKENKIDNILVEKGDRMMYLRHGETVIRSYKISLGGQPIGAKVKEGDQKTPEGKYMITEHNPRSSYHLSLRISYPNQEQRTIAKKMGYSPGGDIMIHGYPNWAIDQVFDYIHHNNDWTDGCIAVTNPEIEEIYRLVQNNTPIEIRP